MAVSTWCQLLPLLLLAMQWPYSAAVEADDYVEMCKLFKNDTRLRMPGSCSEYISCVDSSAEVYSCIAPTIYDSSKQNCIDAAIGTTADADDYCRNRCEGKDGVWVADPASCNGYYYCSANVAYFGECPDGYTFNEKDNMCDNVGTCLYASSICELVPANTAIRNADNCATYYVCTKGELTEKKCPKEQYFDVEKGGCVPKQNIVCNAHPVPDGLCSTVKGPAPGNKADGATCNGYFYCRDLGLVPDLEPVWVACPPGLFFSADAKKCIDPIDVKCTYNRCAGRGNMMVQSSTCDCRNYIVCEDGMQVKEYSCYGDMFFDEKLQACVYYPIFYAACDSTKC